MQAFDLAIVGAGPSGLAAAITAAEFNLKAILLDEQPTPGGQIYRAIESLASNERAHRILGPDYLAGLDLVKKFRQCNVKYMPLTQVWQLEHEKVWFRRSTGAGVLRARQILIATGAMERPMPLPGWTLPGVMTCGAGQTLLKSAGLAWEGSVILAGAGPLLLLLASQLLRAGIRPAAILETETSPWEALPHIPSFLGVPSYATKGLALLAALRMSRVPFYKGVSDLRVLGDSRAQAVRFSGKGGETVTLAADLVLLHQGVVPNVQLAMATRCQHDWSAAQRAFVPKTTEWGESTSDGILVAGDSGGILGAKAAELSGRLAALAAAERSGHIDRAERDRQGKRNIAALQRHRAARQFLDASYRPQQENIVPHDDETIVCRCEETRAGDIRDLVERQHCPGPNQMKAFVRSGMGPCQGRLCGLTVVELIAEQRQKSPGEIGYYRIRPPIKPLSLGDLAAEGCFPEKTPAGGAE